MNKFDDLKLKYPKNSIKVPLKRRRKIKQGAFIKGPLSLIRLIKIGKMSPAALKVEIALNYYKGLKKTNYFKIGNRDLALFGDSEDTIRRGLKELEKKGFISVTRNLGQKPFIEIIDI